MFLFMKTIKAEEPQKLQRWQQILLDGADAIERDGWTRGRFYRKGAMCAVGGMAYGVTGRKNSILAFIVMCFNPSFREALSKLKQEIDHRSVIHWNDLYANSRTITQTMRKAANNEHQ